MISELASIKELDNSALLSKNAKNTRKTKEMLPGEINLQSKQDLICHVAEVKVATSRHSMADVIPFFSVFIIPFKSKASIKPKENILYTQ